jgi:hypothetical protein
VNTDFIPAKQTQKQENVKILELLPPARPHKNMKRKYNILSGIRELKA